MFYKKKIEEIYTELIRLKYRIANNEKNHDSEIRTLLKSIDNAETDNEENTKVLNEQWKYIQALLDAEKQNRKDLNSVIAKINQMKTKGKK